MASRLIPTMRPLVVIAVLAVLLPSCCPTVSEKSAKPTPPCSDMHVVLVHGFLQCGNSYKRLQGRLEKRGVHCLVARLKPSDGRTGLSELAGQLSDQIEAQWGTDQEFSVVAYSMGGLVSRYYLQQLGGAARCRQLITVSTPHHGTWMARLYPGKGAREMRRGSQFLDQLAATEDRLGDMPLASYRTPMDLMILPSTSSIWDRAVNLSCLVALHPLMLQDGKVLDDLENRLLSAH